MLTFNKVTLHNFGSYGHAEVDLSNKGFCAVSGKNRYAKDNAMSNGSGKSFIWSGICFALTGETIQGLKSNLKNLNAIDEDSYVTLDFKCDSDSYVITRILAPRTDMKISKNGEDISGKGIRESEKVLATHLPDLNKDLIASTMIIGQGMPNKFSSFSPSGRKELLEKLTKSDYMIEHIKEKVAERSKVLRQKSAEYHDGLLVHNTTLSSINKSLEKLRSEIAYMVKPDFDKMIDDIKDSSRAALEEKAKLEADRSARSAELEAATEEKSRVASEKAKESSEEYAAYSEKNKALLNEKFELMSKSKTLSEEISRLKKITDVCPTCGQKLIGVEKPDTTDKELALSKLTAEIKAAEGRISDCDQKHKTYQSSIEDEFAEKIRDLTSKVSSLKIEVSKLDAKISALTAKLSSNDVSLAKAESDKANWQSAYDKKKRDIDSYEVSAESESSLIKTISEADANLNEHLAVITKIETLIKRDLRGYLLANVISVLDKKAKAYSSVVFGHTDLEIKLDGNALDIIYCGKMLDNLSGGERQRVDLITQFAIRDVLMKYFGMSSNILVLDEITDFLDKTSCSAVMSLIEKELDSVESVFIISHHADELELPIDSEMHILKDEDGISSVQNIL